MPRLIQALRANDLNVINRAAWALGNLNALEAVPRLIPVLLSTDSQLVIVSPDEFSSPTPPLVPVGISKNGQNVAVMNGPVVARGGCTVRPWFPSVPSPTASKRRDSPKRPWRFIPTRTPRS